MKFEMSSTNFKLEDFSWFEVAKSRQKNNVLKIWA